VLVYGTFKQKVTVRGVSAKQKRLQYSPKLAQAYMSRGQSLTDRLIHSRGPATAKLLSPSHVCVRGTATLLLPTAVPMSYLRDELAAVRQIQLGDKMVQIQVGLFGGGWVSTPFPTKLF